MNSFPHYRLSSGAQLPSLGFGTWQLQGDVCTQAVKTAWEIGYRHYDTADIYGNHEAIAKVLSEKPRKEMQLVSKLWYEDHDPKRVEPVLDRILKELKTDYLDLFLVHWPKIKQGLPQVLFEMQKMQEKGKILSTGLCNASMRHIEEVIRQGLNVPINQVELHPFFQQKALTRFCKLKDIVVTAYSPLARGKVLDNAILQEIGKHHGKTPAQIALAWCLQKGFIAIPKASSKKRMEENFSIFSIQLSKKEEDLIDTLNQNLRLISPEFSEFDD